MKQKLLSLLALTFGLASSTWAELSTTTIGGKTYYQIGTAQNLIEFASLVNAGGAGLTANAVLTGDINMSDHPWEKPIGCFTPKVNNANVMYKGHFDGQGYAITNLTYTTTQDYHGLFGVISTGAIIENFSVSGTVTNDDYGQFGTVGFARDKNPIIRNVKSSLNIDNSKTGQRIGGILGATYTGSPITVTIEHCTYSGTLRTNDSGDSGNYGGFIGYVQSNTENSYPVITNCLFDGKLENTAGTPGNCTFGGIVGYVGSGPTVSIKNCLSIGKVTSKIYGQFFGAVKDTKCSIVSSFYKGSIVNGAASGAVTLPTLEATLVSDAMLESGEVCNKLNNQSEIAWYQTIGADLKPTLNSSHQHVYQITNGNYVNEIGANTLQINYPSDMKELAGLVNAGSTAINAKLANDINMSDVTWTPIGTSGNPYTGIFDGDGHSITGFNKEFKSDNSGLFGYISNGADIKNFSIEGEISSNKTCIGVIGRTTSDQNNTITISGINSNLKITITAAGKKIGGILGGSYNGTVNIDHCTYSNILSVDDNGSSGNYGGIVGYVNNDGNAHLQITNCLFDGTVTYTATTPGTCTLGGIVGYAGANPKVTITNCLSIGKVESQIYGQFFGAVKSNPSTNCSIINSYYQGKYINGAANGGVTLSTLEAESVDDDELASGEICYNLNDDQSDIAFYQTIGTDTYPTLSSSSEQVRYVGTAGYTTFYDATNDWGLLGDAHAYIGTINGSALHLDEIDDIPAGNAVVIGGTYYNKVSTTATATTTGNVLLGSDGSINGDGVNIYALANGANGVGFYPVGDGVTIPAGKAYLDLEGVLVKTFLAFDFGEDDPTGLNGLKDFKDSKDAIYNLAGQRISKMQKGINIINGKKILK